MRFSVRFNNDLPVRAYPALARAAEDAGFDQFWVSDDLFLRSVWVILTGVAQATNRIGIGTGIVNPYTMHPAEMAMAAGALDELSDGRLCLGLSSGAADFLSWVGIPAGCSAGPHPGTTAPSYRGGRPKPTCASRLARSRSISGP